MENLIRPGTSVMQWLAQACLLLAVLVFSSPAGAQTADRPESTEGRLKAAYLHKFASFAEWPDGAFAAADSPLVIGAIGANELIDELERIVADRKINGRSISVRTLRRGESPAGMHMLFIGRLDKAALLEVLAAAKGHPILTVTDSDDAHALGSMVSFVVIDDKLRFDVALKPVVQSRVRISARMLAAARKVAQASP